VTYPALRPSPESEKSLRSTSSTSSASTVKPRPRPAAPASPPRSSTSSHVRRAIQTALELEAGDRDQSPQTISRNLPALSTGGSKPPSDRSPSQASPSALNLTPTDSHTKGRPSKLALLAQAKAMQMHIGPVDAHCETKSPVESYPNHTRSISLQSLTADCNHSDYNFIPVTPQLKYCACYDTRITPGAHRHPAIRYICQPAKTVEVGMRSKKRHESLTKNFSCYRRLWLLPDMPPMFLPKTTRSRASPSASLPYSSMII